MKTDTRYFAKIAVLAAVAFVLMLVEFPLPFVPPFYKLDFSETAVLIGAFAMGPLAGVIIEAIKIVLNILFTGTQTAYVGEIANFLIGISFCLPASLIYQKYKTRENAVKGLAIGGLTMIIVGLLMNALVLLPAYSYFYHMPMDALIGMGTKLMPLIHDRFTFVLFATSPFNLIKAILVSLITMLLYKRISPLLHR
ncbi:MAG: Gx transporter family protein [Solobacterium sp.]|nr:Gx transporter family protein [Solobacterium sp.]